MGAKKVLRTYAKAEWDSFGRRWLTVKVTEEIIHTSETPNEAEKYGEACGLTVVGKPHLCFPGCDHPPIGGEAVTREDIEQAVDKVLRRLTKKDDQLHP